MTMEPVVRGAGSWHRKHGMSSWRGPARGTGQGGDTLKAMLPPGGFCLADWSPQAQVPAGTVTDKAELAKEQLLGAQWVPRWSVTLRQHAQMAKGSRYEGNRALCPSH